MRSMALVILGGLLGTALTAALLPRGKGAPAAVARSASPTAAPSEARSNAPSTLAADLRKNMSDVSLAPPRREGGDRPLAGVDLGPELARLASVPGVLQGTSGALTEVVAELRHRGTAGIDLLSEALQSPDSKERLLAARVLAQFSQPEAVTSLFDAASSDADPKVRATASQSLALMEAGDTVQALRKLAQSSPGTPAEINAIYGLCRQGDPEGFERAAAYVGGTERPVRDRAILAANLAQLSDERLLPVIDRSAVLFAGLPPVMSAVIEYYRGLGTPEATSRLTAIAQNSAVAPNLRSFASAAVAHN
jgi:HEAT repeat protein